MWRIYLQSRLKQVSLILYIKFRIASINLFAFLSLCSVSNINNTIQIELGLLQKRAMNWNIANIFSIPRKVTDLPFYRKISYSCSYFSKGIFLTENCVTSTRYHTTTWDTLFYETHRHTKLYLPATCNEAINSEDMAGCVTSITISFNI